MNKPSLRKQIDAMCKECIFDGSLGSGTWREQVGYCTSKKCPLYNLRPLPTGKYHEWQVELSNKYVKDVTNGKRKPLKVTKLVD